MNNIVQSNNKLEKQDIFVKSIVYFYFFVIQSNQRDLRSLLTEIYAG